jgi:hypothetical protein
MMSARVAADSVRRRYNEEIKQIELENEKLKLEIELENEKLKLEIDKLKKQINPNESN